MLSLENIKLETIWSNLIDAMMKPFSTSGQPDDTEAKAKSSPKLVRVVDPETGEDFVYPDAGEEKNLPCYRPTPVDVSKMSRKNRQFYKKTSSVHVIDGEEVKVEYHYIDADNQIYLINGNAIAIDWRRPDDEPLDLNAVGYVAPMQSRVPGHEHEEVKDLNDYRYREKGKSTYYQISEIRDEQTGSRIRLSKRDEEALARHFYAANLKRIAYPEMRHPNSAPQQPKPPDGPGFH